MCLKKGLYLVSHFNIYCDTMNDDILNIENENVIQKALEVVKVLSNQVRMQLIMGLAELQPIQVNALCEELKIDRVVVSQQLSILRKYEFVRVSRDGRTASYELNYDKIVSVIDILNRYF